MIYTYRNMRFSFKSHLLNHGYRCTNDAFRSFRRIDFSRLSALGGNEQRFLQESFYANILDAHARRTSAGLHERKFQSARARHGFEKINARDVRVAMITLGTTIREADDGALSEESVSLISDICPYC